VVVFLSTFVKFFTHRFLKPFVIFPLFGPNSLLRTCTQTVSNHAFSSLEVPFTKTGYINFLGLIYSVLWCQYSVGHGLNGPRFESRLCSLLSLLFSGHRSSCPGRDINHSSPTSVKFKNEWRYISTPSYTPPWCVPSVIIPLCMGET
jgi:hypothetical protein